MAFSEFMNFNRTKMAHPLSSTSWTVLLVSLKLKHRLTFMPNFPVGVAKKAKLSYSIMFGMQMNELNYHLTGRSMLSAYIPGCRWLAVLCLAHESPPSWREMSHSCIWNNIRPVHVLLSRFYLDFIHKIWINLDKIGIKLKKSTLS